MASSCYHRSDRHENAIGNPESLRSGAALASLSRTDCHVHRNFVDAYQSPPSWPKRTFNFLCAEGIGGGLRLSGVLKLIDLAWMKKKKAARLWRQHRDGEPNEQGAVDMGVAPEFLPGQAVTTRRRRDRLAKAWETTLPATTTGANLIEILKRCKSGQIKPLLSSAKTLATPGFG